MGGVLRSRAKLLSGQCEAPQGAKPVRFDLRRGPRVGGVLRSRAKLLSGQCEAPQGAKYISERNCNGTGISDKNDGQYII